RLRRCKLENLTGVGRGISPFVLGDNSEAKRLPDDRKRWQDRLPARGRPRNEIKARLPWQLAKLVGRKRVDRRFQFYIRFDVGLQPETGRALSTVAQTHRHRVTFAQVAAADPYQQGVRERTNVEPVEPNFQL